MTDWNSLRKPADGVISRLLNRRVSLAITKRLAPTKIRPNQVSLVTMALGVAAGVIVARGSYWSGVAGAVLLQIQSTLDGVDGELARLKSQCSRLGQWLDTISDDLGEFSLMAGTAFAVPPGWLKTLGLVGIGSYALAKALLYRHLATVLDSGNLQDFDWGTDRSFAAKIQIAFRHDFLCLLSVALALAGRLDVMLVLLSVGSVVMLTKLLFRLFRRPGAVAAETKEAS